MGVFDIGTEMRRVQGPRPLLVDLAGGLLGAAVAVALLIALF